MKYAFIREHAGRWPVVHLCRLLEVPRSAYYDWRDRPGQVIPPEELALRRRMKALFKASRDSLGSRTLGRKLRTGCRYLVKDFGTSQSPKSTRLRDSHCSPGRPASVPATDLPVGKPAATTPTMAGRRVGCACMSPIRRHARALRLPGTTRLVLRTSLAGSERQRNDRTHFVAVEIFARQLDAHQTSSLYV